MVYNETGTITFLKHQLTDRIKETQKSPKIYLSEKQQYAGPASESKKVSLQIKSPVT